MSSERGGAGTTFDRIPDGSRVLVDANILLYAVTGRSEESVRLLRRCAEGGVEGVLTTVILGEFNHRRMLQEAQALGLASSNPARALAERRELVRRLGRYAVEVRDLLDGGLRVEPVLTEDFPVALELQRTLQVLTNDSLNLAAAARLGIGLCATADRTLRAPRGIVLHHPSDLA